MRESTYLESNLLALSTKNPSLSVRLTQAHSAKNIHMEISKTGHKIPVVLKDSKYFPLHSLVDPIKEGERYYSFYGSSGFLIVFGFGGAYHIKPFLKRKDISELIIVDKDISIFKSLLENLDLRAVILDKRVNFLIDPAKEEIQDFLLSRYLPAVCGNLHIIPLRSRIQMEQSYFNSLADSIRQLITSLSEDFSVQSYFGKRWFLNTVLNLQSAEDSVKTLSPIRKAFITGAGPSLELQIPSIKHRRNQGFLIATDTSLPTLLQNDLIPDVIVSIDCQHITYHHFLHGYPENIPLVLDLASPSSLTRLTDNLIFFTSGHPFSRYVNTHWRKFPYIDTSGGNVSHAAVSLADTLGAREIELFGTDFSFPQGKCYARGTYLYPYFNSISNKIDPLENEFFRFLFRNDEIVKTRTNWGMRYTTRPMISYKRRLEDFSSTIRAKLISAEGRGEPLSFHANPLISAENYRNRIFSAGPSACRWKEFLEEYRTGISNLPEAGESLSEYLSSLTPDQKNLCVTLFPAGAAIRKDLREQPPGAKIIEATVKWTCSVIDRSLTYPDI